MDKEPAFERSLGNFDELAHELRTPLASILSISEILRDYPDLAAADRQRFLEAMNVEAGRIATLVEYLLQSGRLDDVVAAPSPRAEPGRGSRRSGAA